MHRIKMLWIIKINIESSHRFYGSRFLKEMLTDNSERVSDTCGVHVCLFGHCHGMYGVQHELQFLMFLHSAPLVLDITRDTTRFKRIGVENCGPFAYTKVLYSLAYVSLLCLCPECSPAISSLHWP